MDNVSVTDFLFTCELKIKHICKVYIKIKLKNDKNTWDKKIDLK